MPKLIDLFRERLAQGPACPLAETLGIAVDKFEPGYCLVSMEVEPRMFNPMGTLHGGVFCDLADMAMGIAFFCGLDEGEAMTTLELKINFLRPLLSGRVTAEARVVSRGRTTGLVECDVRDAQGKLAARASTTCYVLKGERAEASLRAMAGLQ